MDFELSQEARLLQQTVRRFVDQELIPLEVPAQYEDENVPPETKAALKEKVKELGLSGLALSKEYGGAGLDELTVTAVQEELFRALVGFNAFARGAFGALAHGSEHLKQKYFYPTLNDEKKFCFAFTDPTSGADPQTMQTNAVRQGDNYVINGRKIFITGAYNADYALLVARMKGSTGRQGITAFLVDTDTPGFKVERIIYTIGHPSGITEWPTEIVLDNVVVPVENRVGEEGDGFGIAQQNLGSVRFSFGIRSYALGKRCIHLARDYAKGRVTFGEPIANRQAVQWMLVDSYTELEMLRWLTYYGAWKGQRGEDIRNEISMIKYTGSETLGRAADRAIQIHGGIGLTRDLPLEKIYRDARVDRVVDGPNEVHRFVVARNILAGRA